MSLIRFEPAILFLSPVLGPVPVRTIISRWRFRPQAWQGYTYLRDFQLVSPCTWCDRRPTSAEDLRTWGYRRWRRVLVTEYGGINETTCVRGRTVPIERRCGTCLRVGPDGPA